MNMILRQSFGVRHCDVLYREFDSVEAVESEIAFARRCHLDLCSIAGHGLWPTAMRERGWYLYTMLREPLARCISHYQYQVNAMGKQVDFDDWIRNERFHDVQVTRLAGCRDLDAAKAVLAERFSFVGLVECFDTSIEALSLLAPYPLNTAYKRMNVARESVLKEAVLSSQSSRRLLESANRLDAELYRYVKEDLFPELLGRASSLSVRSPGFAGIRYLSNVIWRNVVYKPIYKVMR